MRTCTPPAHTRFYAGVDLHARALFVVVLDRDGRVAVANNLPANPDAFRRASAPFRDGLLVACECMHCCYGLADICRDHGLAFVRGHAGALKAVHGCPTKCDRKDAEAIARLLKGGNFPPASAYPKDRRGLRDRRRARLRLVRQRAARYGHVHTARRQANLPPVSNDVNDTGQRDACSADRADPFVRRRVATHLALLEPLDTTIRRLEAAIEDAAQDIFPAELAVLQATPGVGPVRSLTILLEIDTSARFDTRQPFCSYSRRCGAVQSSDNQRGGVGNRTAGNAWLTWAFAEAAVRSAQTDERSGALRNRLAAKLGQAKAYAALAHQLGRAFDHLLHTKAVVDVNRFGRP
jgi:transposase